MSLQNLPLALSLVLMNTISVGMHVCKLPYLRKYFTDEEENSQSDSTYSTRQQAQTAYVMNQALLVKEEEPLDLPAEKVKAWRDEHDKLTIWTTLRVINWIQKEIREKSSCGVCVLKKRESKLKTNSGGKVPPVYKIRKLSNRLRNKKKAVGMTRGISYVAFDGNKALASSHQLLEGKYSRKDPTEIQMTVSGYSRMTNDTNCSVSAVQSIETVMNVEGSVILDSMEGRPTPSYSGTMTLSVDELAKKENLHSKAEIGYVEQLEIERQPQNNLIQPERGQIDLEKGLTLKTSRECPSGGFGFVAWSNPGEPYRISVQVMRNQDLYSWSLNPCELSDLESLRRVSISEQVLALFNTTARVELPKTYFVPHSDEPSTSKEICSSDNFEKKGSGPYLPSDICLPDYIEKNVIKNSTMSLEYQVSNFEENEKRDLKASHATDICTTGNIEVDIEKDSILFLDCERIKNGELSDSPMSDSLSFKEDDDTFEMANSVIEEDSGGSFVTADEDNGIKRKKKRIKRIFSSLLKRSKIAKISLKNKKETNKMDNVPGTSNTSSASASRKWFRKSKKTQKPAGPSEIN